MRFDSLSAGLRTNCSMTAATAIALISFDLQASTVSKKESKELRQPVESRLAKVCACRYSWIRFFALIGPHTVLNAYLNLAVTVSASCLLWDESSSSNKTVSSLLVKITLKRQFSLEAMAALTVLVACSSMASFVMMTSSTSTVMIWSTTDCLKPSWLTSTYLISTV